MTAEGLFVRFAREHPRSCQGRPYSAAVWASLTPFEQKRWEKIAQLITSPLGGILRFKKSLPQATSESSAIAQWLALPVERRHSWSWGVVKIIHGMPGVKTVPPPAPPPEPAAAPRLLPVIPKPSAAPATNLTAPPPFQPVEPLVHAAHVLPDNVTMPTVPPNSAQRPPPPPYKPPKAIIPQPVADPEPVPDEPPPAYHESLRAPYE
eukprot:EG_transcript_24221